jgi:GT2 family glycosyltransferase
LSQIAPSSYRKPAELPAQDVDQLSILIVSFNTAEHLRRCLQSLRAHPSQTACEVIVLDNASSDGSADMVSREFPECRLIRSLVNEGYGVGINRAAQEAQGSYLLLLNPDIEITRGSLDALLEFAKSHPQAGVIGPRLLESDGSLQPSAWRRLSATGLLLETARVHWFLPQSLRSRLLLGGYWPHAEDTKVPWVVGACHLIPRAVWDEVGPLTEETFFGFDDYDYCHRVWKNGYEVWFFAGATLTHHRSVSVKKHWTAGDGDQMYIHNRYLLLFSYWPAWQVKVYGLADILASGVEAVYHLLWSRGGTEHFSEPYSTLLRRRMGLIWQFVTGRRRPLRRFQPQSSGSVERDLPLGGSLPQ